MGLVQCDTTAQACNKRRRAAYGIKSIVSGLCHHHGEGEGCLLVLCSLSSDMKIAYGGDVLL